ncbi:MAG: hypothetical protein AAGA93_04335 [Actinomycetota bacterium]
MSELSPQPVSELAPVRQRLALAEPSCLALIEATSAAPLPDGLTDEMGRRLRLTLRPYDELIVIGDGRFALLLPTLAGPEALRRRMSDVFEAVTDGIDQGAEAPDPEPRAPVTVALGASVRQPQDSADGFLTRVADAVDEARDAGGRTPVIA